RWMGCRGRSVRAAQLVVGVIEPMHLAQESLRQLVQLALARLVGRHGHEGVVPPLGADGDRDRAEGAAVPAAAGRLDRGREPRTEVVRGKRVDVIGGCMAAMEVLHGALSSPGSTPAPSG